MVQRRRSYNTRPYLIWTAVGVAASSGVALLFSGPDGRWWGPILLALAMILALQEIVTKTRRRRIIAQLIVGLAVVILSVWPSRLKLYYAGSKLDGATISFGRSSTPQSCTVIQKDPNVPGLFELCGIWIEKPDDEARYFSLYIDLSTETEGVPGSCWWRTPDADVGYKAGFACNVWTPLLSSGRRWNLPPFYGKPIPTNDTTIRLTVPYARDRVAEATFTLRP